MAPVLKEKEGFQLAEFSEKAWRSIADSRARINIWHGAVRSGKTIASLIAFATRVGNRDPKGQYAMIGKTSQTLERNCIIPMAALFGRGAVSYRPFQGQIRLFGRLVYLVGANDEKAADKIRGLTLTDAYGDEITTWHESMFVMLMSRLSVPGARFYGTTNPDNPGHWLKRNYLDRAHELDLAHWQFRLEDNTALDPAYVDALKREYTGLWYRRFVAGEWTQAEGAVYDMLPESIIIDAEGEKAQRAKQYGERFLAIDYGTTNPFVALDCYIFKDCLYVLDEWRHDSAEKGFQLTNSDYASRLRQFAGHPDYVRACIVDPSATSFKLELRQEGFAVKDGNNAVLDGIRQVASLISQGRLFIAKDKCSGLWDELHAYRWDSRAANSGYERPVKDFDHGPDALRYAVATLKLVRRADEKDEGFEVLVYDI